MSTPTESSHWSPRIQHASLSHGSVTVTAAPIWRRLGASLVDLALLLSLAWLFFMSPAIRPDLPPKRFDWLDYSAQLVTHHAGDLIPWALLSLCIHIIVVAYARHIWSASVGERVFGLRLIDYAGESPRVWQTIMHTFGNILSGCIGGFGYFWALISIRRQTFSNYLSRTVLIDSE